MSSNVFGMKLDEEFKLFNSVLDNTSNWKIFSMSEFSLVAVETALLTIWWSMFISLLKWVYMGLGLNDLISF